MKNLIIGICIAATVAALIAIGVFTSHFGRGFASNIGNWGAVGDFFGGVLNPTFALLSLILIAYTLMQNKKALEQSEKAIEQGTKAIEQNEKALQVSNKELELTRDELANSSEALEEQASLLAIQSFETTFFNMLGLHDKVLKNITYNEARSITQIAERLNVSNLSGDDQCFEGDEAVFQIIKSVESIQRKIVCAPASDNFSHRLDAFTIFKVFYDFETFTIGNYFRNFRQVLSLISNSPLNTADKIKYSSILKAQLSNNELILLMLCGPCMFSKTGSEEFTSLTIEFSLFEYLILEYHKTNRDFLKVKDTDLLIKTSSTEELTNYNKDKLIQTAFGDRHIVHGYWVDFYKNLNR